MAHPIVAIQERQHIETLKNNDMSYDKRNEVQETLKKDIDGIMQLFPKDYSEVVLSMIKGRVESVIKHYANNYNEAFCQDNDLCPMCITGGWRCDSDHK